MSNFGVMHLRVVNPYDPSFREAQSAVGAADLLKNAEQFTSVAEAVADCSLVVGTTAARDRELQHSLYPLLRSLPRSFMRVFAPGRWRSCSAPRSGGFRMRTSTIATGSCIFRLEPNTFP